MMQVRGYLAEKSREKKKTDGATADAVPAAEKSDLAAVVELMREMLDIISRMIGAE